MYTIQHFTKNVPCLSAPVFVGVSTETSENGPEQLDSTPTSSQLQIPNYHSNNLSFNPRSPKRILTIWIIERDCAIKVTEHNHFRLTCNQRHSTLPETQTLSADKNPERKKKGVVEIFVTGQGSVQSSGVHVHKSEGWRWRLTEHSLTSRWRGILGA